MSNNSPSFQPTLLSDSSGDSKLQRINGVATVDNGGGPVPLGGGAASLPSTLILADASTTQAPDLLVLRHTSSGTAAVGFGALFAVELQSAAGALRRMMTDNTFLNVATDAAEEGRREIQLMQGGTIRSCVSVGYRANINAPALFLGPPSEDYSLNRFSGTVQLIPAGTVAMQWTTTAVVSNLRHNFPARAEFGRGANVASATTVTLGADGNLFPITGTTTVQGIVTTNWQAGARITLELASGITITHNSGAPGASAVAIILRAGANLVTSGIYFLDLIFNGTFWYQQG